MGAWTVAYSAVFYFLFGFSWQISLVDSLVTNGLIAFACVLMSNSLSYYIPKQYSRLYVSLLSLILAAAIAFLSKYLLVKLFPSELDYVAFLNVSEFVNFLIILIWLTWCAVACTLWYKITAQSEINERMKITQDLAKEAELNKLRHQLQPHFLFNSLNSVYALTITNPSEAGNMILRLSSFLRGTLKRDDDVWVSVSEEIEYLQLYLDIEKVRFSHRLSVVFSVDENTKDLQLPSTLLQPIVENAIKFGLYNTTVAITIEIDVRLMNQSLYIEVRNPFDPEMNNVKGTGFGLSAIRRRLYLLFADGNLLQARPAENNLYITSLKIPLMNDKNNTD
jgi:LytS/YehU family sensor histidine kinase